MEPRNTTPGSGMEVGGQYPLEVSPEVRVGAQPERLEARPVRVEQQPTAPQALPVVQPVVAPVQPMPVPSPVVATDNPNVAGDDDLIEKEWVERAKNILTQTKDDPHEREKQISALQADYIAKRYGRIIGKVED